MRALLNGARISGRRGMLVHRFHAGTYTGEVTRGLLVAYSTSCMDSGDGYIGCTIGSAFL